MDTRTHVKPSSVVTGNSSNYVGKAEGKSSLANILSRKVKFESSDDALLLLDIIIEH